MNLNTKIASVSSDIVGFKIIYEVWLESGLRTDCCGNETLGLHKNDPIIIDYGTHQDYARVLHCRGEIPNEADSDSLPKILRRVTLQDQSRANENHRLIKNAAKKAKGIIADSELEISMIDLQVSFDRKKATLRFLAPRRVDFRKLVKSLAQSLDMKVELRQVGVRDVSKMRGGIGTCGRVLCCTSWVHEFQSVNVRMAKEQHLSLNNNIISGQCGRLKCCLAFEHESYKMIQEEMPIMGSRIMVKGQEARVLDTTLINKSMLVRVKQDGRVMNVQREQLDDLVETDSSCGDDCGDGSCGTGKNDCDTCGS